MSDEGTEEAPEKPGAPPNQDRPNWSWVLAVLVLCGLALLFAARTVPDAITGPGPDTGGEGTGATGSAVPEGPRAIVVGTVLLEPLPEDRRAVEPTDTDGQTATDGQTGTDRDTAATDGETVDTDPEPAVGTGDETGAEPDPQPWMGGGELTPAPLCTVVAWRDGVELARTTECDGDGGYRLELPPGDSGAVAVEILVPRRLRAVLEGEVAAGETLEVGTVALGEGMEVSGSVLNARNEPVPGVTVTATPNPNLGEPEPWRATSAPDGTFAFDTLPHGPVSLRVEAPGYAVTVVEAVAPERDVLLRLSGLIDLEGNVFADASKLEGAEVRLEGSAIWPPIKTTVGVPAGDPAAGPFVFGGLVDGVYAVEVVVARTDGRPEYASIPLENVTPDLKVDLALIPANRVPVRVEDPDGEPVPGARVTLAYASIGLLQRVDTTNEEGKVRIGPVVPGPYVVRAEADGYLPAAPIEVDVAAPDGGNVEEEVLVLARPARISGIVTDESGQPVPGAEVLVDSDELFTTGESQTRAKLLRVQISAGTGSLGVTKGRVPDIPTELEVVEGEEEEGPGVITTDERGRFDLTMLVPGNYRLRGTSGQHAASAPVEVTVGSGEHRRGVELVLRRGVPFTGQITDANGRPLPRATIELADGIVITSDADGVFDAGYRRGNERVVVRAQGYAARELDLRFDDRPVDLDVELEELTGRIEGRVVDTNGKPVSDASLVIRFESGLEPPTFVETDRQGVFSLDRQPTGKVTIELEHDAYVGQELRAVIEDGGGDELRAVMTEGWELELSVTDDEGAPLAGVHVKAGDLTGVTDKTGRLSLDRLGAEKVDVVLTSKGRIPQTISVQLDDEESNARRAERTVELLAGGALSGVVTDDRAIPVVGAKLEVFAADGRTRLAQGRSGRKGRFSIEGVPEGDVVMRATPPRDRKDELVAVELETDVVRGEVTDDLELRFDTP